MKSKKALIFSAVLCCLFLILSSALIVPIRAATSESSLKPASLDFAKNILKQSDNTYIIAIGSSKMVMENLPDNCFKATYISANGQNTTFETVLQPVSNQTNIQNNVNSDTTIMQRVLLVNGKEAVKLPINNQITPQPTKDSNNLTPLTDATYYWWDGVYFGQNDGYQYPHPVRSYYDIYTFQDWGYAGNQLFHYQFSDANSQTLAEVSSGEFGAAIGILIAAGGLGDPIADAIGTIVGIIVAAFIYNWENTVLLDEEDCMWWWISQAFINWVDQNQWTLLWEFLIDPAWATYDMFQAFYSMGYLRVGAVTFYDGIGAGNPSPPPPDAYVSSIAEYGTWANGGCNNPYNAIGQPDGNYAQLYGGNYNDGAYLVGWTDVASGAVYIYGYSYTGYYTHLHVYVSYNNYYDWTEIGTFTVSSDSPQWIYCGYGSNFRYIAVAAIDDNGMSARMEIDAIRVTG